MRAENQHLISRIEERLTEELLENLRPRTDDYVFCCDADAVLTTVGLGHGFAERRQAHRRTIVGGMVFDRHDAGLTSRAGAWEGTVSDLKLGNVLTLRLEPFGHSEHVKSRFSSQTLRKSAESYDGRGGYGFHFDRIRTERTRGKGLLARRSATEG